MDNANKKNQIEGSWYSKRPILFFERSMKTSVVVGIRSIECSKNMCSPCMGCHHAIARPNEKKLTDIIEFRCNKLQWSKIYGNLARNFKVNGILSKLNFSSFQIFFNSKVPLYRDISRVQNLKILFPVRQASAKEIRISSATSSQTNNTVPAFNLYFQSESLGEKNQKC